MVLLRLAVIFLIDGELCHIDAALVYIGDEAGGNLVITVGIFFVKIFFLRCILDHGVVLRILLT